TTTNETDTDWVSVEGDANSGPVGTWAHIVATYKAPVSGDATSAWTPYVPRGCGPTISRPGSRRSPRS
ncbi:hypothetical protein DLE01_01770, partial [Streptomyces sp. FT05W]